MSRLLSLCLGLLALLSACGPIYDTQYSLVPPTSIEGRRCVGQCQQNRTICRQSTMGRARAIDLWGMPVSPWICLLAMLASSTPMSRKVPM